MSPHWHEHERVADAMRRIQWNLNTEPIPIAEERRACELELRFALAHLDNVMLRRQTVTGEPDRILKVDAELAVIAAVCDGYKFGRETSARDGESATWFWAPLVLVGFLLGLLVGLLGHG